MTGGELAPGEPKPCPGCGGLFGEIDGPTHAYMTSSPGCWAAYGEVLAREYSEPRLMAVHRLSVDAYAVQHPGDGSRRAVQSVGLHLARLMVQLDEGMRRIDAGGFMVSLAERKHELPLLRPPPPASVTVADVAGVDGTDAHIAAVRRWARAAFDQWSPHHAFIRAWLGRILEPAP